MFKLFEWIIDVIGWLWIAASPLLIGTGFAYFIYLKNPSTLNLILGVLIAGIGLVIGIFWASKIWKSKKGTMSYLSKVMETPELDQKNEQNERKDNFTKH